MTNPLIISRLIEVGYDIYLPLTGDNVIIVKAPISDELEKCLTTTASQDKTKSPILRCPPEPMLTAVVDTPTRTVWIIPSRYTEGKQVLRLGHHYEEFIIPEPTSRSYIEQKELRAERMGNLKSRAYEHAMTIAKKQAPSKTTLQAVEQLDSGNGITFASADELFAELDKRNKKNAKDKITVYICEKCKAFNKANPTETKRFCTFAKSDGSASRDRQFCPTCKTELVAEEINANCS